MEFSIILPYEGAEQHVSFWANEEKSINFRQEFERAARCTLSFAAVELKKYLLKTLQEADIHILSSQADQTAGLKVWLMLQDIYSQEGGFILKPCENGVQIIGEGRAGVLYGVYELLKLQGWRWYAPGANGELMPEKRASLHIPEKKAEFRPAMKLGRGFDFEGALKESEQLWLWMAKNRLNLASYRCNTGPLLRKLGMQLKLGGHIFERILDPDRITPSGSTLWEEHQDWYGLPEDGIRKKENAHRTQFCVSQKELLDFLGEELLQHITGEWKEADRIDVWGFDTWGNTCQCDECRRLGNETDQSIYFLSAMREYIDRARRDGRLDHDVKLIMCSYEGTTTIAPPQKAVPQNLLDAGDYVVFYQILRCYAHNLDDGSCTYNAFYNNCLEGWLKKDVKIPVMMGEYYNVSKFEDLPLLFTKTMCNDVPKYIAMGVGGITYMHIPMVNWAMRTLTQYLYAELSWNPGIDANQLLDEYFEKWYGAYSADMKKAYDSIEEAWLLSASWRSWGPKSFLSNIFNWNGKKPLQPFKADDHFSTPEGVVESGRKSVFLLKQALEIIDQALKRERIETAKQAFIPERAAVNPFELSSAQQKVHYETRLGEDKRLLIYGLNTMMLMTEVAAYYNALYDENKIKAEESWCKIEEIEEKMDSSFAPVTHDKIELVSKDTLTRTQLRDILRRCRKHRIECVNNR